MILQEAVDNNAIELGIDHTALVQELSLQRWYITRVETLEENFCML
jgi:hypothetical protein